MSKPQFSITVKSFTPPTLPLVPANVDPKLIKAATIPNIYGATSPMEFTVLLPSARPKNPLHPATHLILAYRFDQTGEHLVDEPILPEHLVSCGTEEEPHLYTIEVAPKHVARVKVNEGRTTDANVGVYSWKGEKLLGRFDIGHLEGLGIAGLKSEEIHKMRVEAWREAGKKV